VLQSHGLSCRRFATIAVLAGIDPKEPNPESPSPVDSYDIFPYERTDFASRHFANVFEAKQMVFLNQHHCCFVSAEDISRARFRSHREQS
jgi:hypothetical protein